MIKSENNLSLITPTSDTTETEAISTLVSIDLNLNSYCMRIEVDRAPSTTIKA